MNSTTGALPGPGCSGSVVVPGLGWRNGYAAAGEAGLDGRNGYAAAGQAGWQLGQGPAQQVRHLLT
jgi:hypothetical protein